MSESGAARLDRLVREKKILVCCGAGGVGKTTTSAALGLAAARAGRRVLVLTIDPARRLAEALGIPESSSKPTLVPRERLAAAGVTGTGELHAWMLDPRVVFDGMVRRLAPSEQRAQQILDNRLYRHLSETVAGMQEYTAAEALYDLASTGAYDLVVLDTPPSRNALEFLDAPGRLSRFLDEKVISFFLPEGTRRSGLWKRAGELVNGVCTRVFGDGFFEELQQFMGAFSGMFAAMRHHAEGVRALLESKDSAFLLVTSPEQAALDEAAFFRGRIADMGLPFGGYVLNRSDAILDGLTAPETLVLGPEATDVTRAALAKLVVLGLAERLRAERDRVLLKRLAEQSPGALAVAAPHLGEAIEDLAGLALLAQGLTSDASES